jgi:hypothetical protein
LIWVFKHLTEKKRCVDSTIIVVSIFIVEDKIKGKINKELKLDLNFIFNFKKRKRLTVRNAIIDTFH